jgi:hypothetical protein
MDPPAEARFVTFFIKVNETWRLGIPEENPLNRLRQKLIDLILELSRIIKTLHRNQLKGLHGEQHQTALSQVQNRVSPLRVEVNVVSSQDLLAVRNEW